MKLRNLLIIAVISAVTFTSCRDNNREVDDDQIELDRRAADRDAEMRANEDRMERESNDVSARISENRNLSTFSENMNRNQVTTSMRAGATGTSATGTTTQSQTGTQTETGNQTQTGTTTGNQTQTGTTTGDQTQTGTTTGTTGDRATGNTGQAQSMQGQSNYTIFAPSNDAYEGLSDAQRQEMTDTQNRDRNVASINYLMVEERLTEEQLRQQIQNSNGTYNIRTMQGENITATMDGDNIVLRDASGNQARITETDSEASDGVVHVIDGVLRPKDPSQNEAANRTNNTNTGTNTDMERSTNTTDGRNQ